MQLVFSSPHGEGRGGQRLQRNENKGLLGKSHDFTEIYIYIITIIQYAEVLLHPKHRLS